MDNRVKELRSAAGLRQEDLADQVGVSRQTIISIESGRYNPSLELGWRLSKALGVAIEELFRFGEGDER
jgi:putative transcriptional regulator